MMAKLKRLMAPKMWPIERKTKKYTITPSPGPHSKNDCLPLGIVIRDLLRYARTLKEVNLILKNGIVKIDGRMRKHYNFPVGLMDVITLSKQDGVDESFRIVPKKEGLRLVKINKDESSIKPLKVVSKKFLHGKKIQISLHDGTNIIGNNEMSTGDVIVYEFDKKKINSIIKMKKGAVALITHGRNMGAVGKIEKIIITMNPKPNQIVLAIGNTKLTIPKDYVFVLGEEKPLINLGEE